MASDKYDSQITSSMPYYNEFGMQAIDIARHLGFQSPAWLDTGCGTGTLGLKILKEFPLSRLVLTDPSEAMLDIARSRYYEGQAEFHLYGSQNISFSEEFDVVTAIQCNHYLSRSERADATKRIFNALKPGGLYVFFENIQSDDSFIADLEFRRWEDFRINHGLTDTDLKSRVGVKFFPISVEDHLSLLKDTGFSHISLCWRSYTQAGIYAVK